MKGRTTDYYSSVIEVIYYTNFSKDVIDPQGREGLTDEEFIKRLEEYLREASDYVERYTGRQFFKEVREGKIKVVPPGIHGIVRRIVSDIVAHAILKRDEVFMSLGDNSSMITDSVFNSNIKYDLDLYKKKVKPLFFMTGVRRKEEVEVVENIIGEDEDTMNYIEIEVTNNLTSGDIVNIYTDYDYGILKVRKADALLGYEAHGYVVEDGVVGENIKVYLDGVMNVPYSLLAGRNYYLGSEGKLDVLPPNNSKVRQLVGYSIDTYRFKFNADESSLGVV